MLYFFSIFFGGGGVGGGGGGRRVVSVDIVNFLRFVDFISIIY